MKGLLSIELYKLVRTKRFWICIAIGIAVCTLNVLYYSGGYAGQLEQRAMAEEYYGAAVNPEYPAMSLYNTWIGNEGISFGFSIMYFIFPFLCCIPYGWSMREEIRSGYLKNIAGRTGRKKYFAAKGSCVFLSGGITMLVPLLYNFIVMAMFIPAVKPDPRYPYYLIQQVNFLSDLYCEKPLAFNLLYLLFSFIYCGLIAAMSFACCYFVKSKVLTVIIPTALIFFCHYLSSMNTGKYEYSPLYIIHPTPVRGQNSGLCLFLYMAVMLVIILAVMFAKGNRKYEIF